MLADLYSVSRRSITSAASIESNLGDILDAVDQAKTLQTVDPIAIRLALDALVRYWEARWSTY